MLPISAYILLPFYELSFPPFARIIYEEWSYNVILSEAKDLGPTGEILRFTQDDTVG